MSRFDSINTRRREQVYEQNPTGYAAHVRSRWGHDPATLERLVDIVNRISHNPEAQLQTEDVAYIAKAHQGVSPGFINQMAAHINALPWSQRSHALIGALSGDVDAVNGQPGTSEAFKASQRLAEDMGQLSIVGELNARAGTEAREPWKPEPGSVRDLLDRQINKAQHHVEGRLADPYDVRARDIHRLYLASEIETAGEHLRSGQNDLRSSLEAAFDMHNAENEAQEHYGIGGDSA